jgi:hypothetical protein
MPSKSNPIISSHRDAATRVSKYLRESHGVDLKPIAALEIVARALGANNWQTLKAMADQGRAPRVGDGVWFSGNPDMLPPIGGPSLAEQLRLSDNPPATGRDSVVNKLISRGLVTARAGGLHSGPKLQQVLPTDPAAPPGVGGTSYAKAMRAALGTSLEPVTRSAPTAPLGEFFLGDIEHDGTPGLVGQDTLEKGVQDFLQSPRQVAGAGEKLDLRVDQSDVQSMSPPTTRDSLWYALVRRATEHKSSLLPDVDPLLDWVQHDELKVVLTPTQRAAVSRALHSPVSIASGYPDSGKALIAEAIVRIGRLAGLKNIVNARKGDAMPVDEGVFIAPEYRDKEVGSAFNSLSVEHLEPYLAGSELLIIDEHVTGNKYLFWDVVRAAPANCRIVILGQIPMDDGSEMSRMFKDLVKQNFAKFTQLHEVLRQQHLRFTEVANLEEELRGATHQPDHAIGVTKVLSNPRGYSRDAGTSPGNDVAAARSSVPTNSARYDAKFLPDVRPSEAWHIQDYLYSPNARNFVSNELTGKWCVVCDKDTVDEMWAKVCQEIRTYRLFSALVSSPNNARAHGGTYVICVFTPDWADEEDVVRARQVLRELGVTQEIGYKRDIETFNGVYGTPAEWYYRA